MEHKTLLLTSWYFPHRVLRWQDAITMMYLGKADVVVSYDEKVSSPSTTLQMPAVLRLRRKLGKVKRGVRFSRVNVFTRDNYTCQYCNNRFPASKLSYDHVTPRANGGRTIWENIVTACKKCNAEKADRTCDESGMWPIKPPKRPKALPMTAPLIHQAPEEWAAFLPTRV